MRVKYGVRHTGHRQRLSTLSKISMRDQTLSVYEHYCLPHFINFACGLKVIQKQRDKVVPLAEGRVLEIGMGSGLNIPYYNRDKVEFVWGLEPSEGMRQKAQANISKSPLEVRWLHLPSEEIPLDTNSVDTVVLTYTLCTIPDWQKALLEMRRVLKPGGKMVFSEHGAAPDASVLRWQNRINPLWKKIAGGCHLNRPISELIKQGGFELQKIDSCYLPGPKFASFHYWGVAK